MFHGKYGEIVFYDISHLGLHVESCNLCRKLRFPKENTLIIHSQYDACHEYFSLEVSIPWKFELIFF
jgi:hypothetical protein